MWLVRIELIEEDQDAEERRVASRVARITSAPAAQRFYNWLFNRFENYGLIRKLNEQEKIRLFGMQRGPRKAS